jgi:hypothetical protein
MAMPDEELSEKLTARVPVVPHQTIPGIRCPGHLLFAVEGTTVELQCTECGAVAGVVQIEILKSLLRLDYVNTRCTHCGREHVFAGMSASKPYVCHQCGEAVAPEAAGSDLDPERWVIRTLRRKPPEAA